jgi:hypothetical protein
VLWKFFWYYTDCGPILQMIGALGHLTIRWSRTSQLTLTLVAEKCSCSQSLSHWVCWIILPHSKTGSWENRPKIHSGFSRRSWGYIFKEGRSATINEHWFFLVRVAICFEKFNSLPPGGPLTAHVSHITIT